jgi:hypothetical protein
VIIKKLSPTVCYVQFHGTTPFDLYSGLSPGKVYVVGTDGKPATAGDPNYPVIGGSDAFQQLGVATSDDELLLSPMEVLEGQPVPAGSRFFGQPLSGPIDGTNVTFDAPMIFVASGPSAESVYLNGVRQESGVGNDYVSTESSGLSTGYDRIEFLVPPKVGDKLAIDFVPVS